MPVLQRFAAFEIDAHLDNVLQPRMIDGVPVEKTVTLDEDVAAQVADEMERTGTSPRDVVNTVLRRTLSTRTLQSQPRPFKVRPRRMGPMTGLNLDCTARLLDEIEGPSRK